jgi:4-hydroxy-2-oxoheptanedioate aldolase
MPRVNKCVELLAQGQPIYHQSIREVNFESGKKAAQTWGDYIGIDMEHAPYDISKLSEFMKGLVEGGPTPSGHRTPAVVITLPTAGSSPEVIQANCWMVQQVLATGVHGLLLCRAESPAAIKAYVESARFPFNQIGVGRGLDEGFRGSHGEAMAAAIWGIPVEEYLKKADVWPLNPEGELMLGIKVENKKCLANAEGVTAVPGLAFAEWGPTDLSWSLGLVGGDKMPYPQPMVEARARVFAACKAAGVAFLDRATAETVVEKIKEGVKIPNVRGNQGIAEIGRKFTNRTMPW